MQTSRIILAALLTLVLGACARPQAPQDAQLRLNQAGIVNGSVETGWPGVGALTQLFPGVGYSGSFCTGTLVAPQWVLTAAHCLVDDDGVERSPGLTLFYVGNDARPSTATGWPSAGQLYPADAFFVHPEYDEEYLENDIALVHLEQAATGVDFYPINSAFLNAVGQSVFYVGFGATEGFNSTGGGLKRSTSQDISWIYADTYASDYAGSGTCFGDSGGPGFMTFAGGQTRVVGVNSAIAECNPASDPSCNADPCQRTGISVRVDAYASWISGITGSPLPSCQSDPDLCFCASACQGNGVCDNAACQVFDCESLYGCLADCADDTGCQATCYIKGTDTGKDQLDAMYECFDARCGELEGAAFQECAGQQCEAEIETCLPVGTGPATCREVYDCLVACPDNDNGCGLGCYETGTAAAQDQFDAMSDCWNTQCGNASDFGDCVEAQCGTQTDTCLPPVYGDATCAEVEDCRGGCPNGDTDCLVGCYESGTRQAQDELVAMYDCFETRCSDQDGDAWVECATTQCEAPIAACYPPANCPITGGGCGAGEACYPGIGGNDCFASAGVTVGQACSDTSSQLGCADGLLCVNGTCERMCVLDQHCPAGESCDAPVFSNVAEIGVCETPDAGCTDNDGDGSCVEDDCDDNDPATRPQAAEACGDNKDNNCNDQVDEGCEGCVDGDGDGYCAETDCADDDAGRSPGVAEVCGDGIDQDCDGTADDGCAGGPSTPPDVSDPEGGSDEGGDSGGCSAGPSSGWPGPALLLLLAWLYLARARRNATARLADTFRR